MATKSLTVILSRVNLSLMIFAIVAIFMLSTQLPPIVGWVLREILVIMPWVILLFTLGDLIYQLLWREGGVGAWIKRSFFLILWSSLVGWYAFKMFHGDHFDVGVQKNFYAMILARSFLFYSKQINQQQVKRYVGLLLQKPAHITVLSYLVAITIVSVIFLLPISQQQSSGEGLSALNAVFVTVSAFAVTGLSPIDISTVFSTFGLAVLLVAVQFGGIGIALLGSIMLYVRRSIGISGRTLLAYSFSDEALTDVGRVAGRVLITTLVIQGIGVSYFTIYFILHQYAWLSAFGHALFFSVSAFSNAGFSLWANGSLEPVRFDIFFLGMINFLIIAGVLGFNFIFFEFARIKRHFLKWIRKMHKVTKPLPALSPATNHTLLLWSGYGSLLLMLVIFFLFYAFEYQYSLANYGVIQKYIESMFLSVDAKTAGFMSRDFSTLRLSTQLVFMAGMLIGGVSGGTAGGIKLNTILVVLAGLRSFLHRQPLAKIGHLSISDDDVRKANILLISAIIMVFLGTFLLSITEKSPSFLPLIWEVISALGTTGTSLNFTSELSALGRIIIMIVMLVGRLGALTLFSVVQERNFKKEPSYPLGNIYLG